MSGQTKQIAWFWLPFVAVWNLIAFVVGATGRFVAVMLGLVLMIVGLVISLTIIGALVGIPLTLVGLFLVLRGLF